MSGGPRELAADDRKKDGMYEIPRSCISQLWCSKGEHRGHMVSFVFASGEVLTVHSTLVTCLKMQHRAAPTERNLVNALKVAMGDQRADPALTIDDGCVTLGTVSDLASSKSEVRVDRHRTALVDLTLGGDGIIAGPLLSSYALGDAEKGDIPRDVVTLLHQADGRDFPRSFREKLATALLGEGGSSGISSAGVEGKQQTQSRWRRMSFPMMSVNATISLLAHYRNTGTLGSVLATTSFRDGRQEARASSPPRRPEACKEQPGSPSGKAPSGGLGPKGVTKIMRRPS